MVSATPIFATERNARVISSLEEALTTLQGVVRTVAPGSLSGDEARALVARLSECERVCASGVALYSPRVTETGSWAKEGHASAQDWLGAHTGTSSGVAKSRLAAAHRAARDRQLTEALKDGELSADQLGVVTKTAAEVPGAGAELLGLIDGGASHQELTAAARGLHAAARSRQCEALRRARVHAHRHFRVHQDEGGGIKGEFFCDEIAWAAVAPSLEAETTARWKAAGGGTEPLEAHRLDAFLDLMGRAKGVGGCAGAGTGTGARVVVVVSAEALRRGTTGPGELCEIEGIGPVSVEAATELIGEAALHYVIKEGFDVKTVTKSTRDAGICLDVALWVRDRTCAATGCGRRLGLETDHRQVDFADGGPTSLDNLVRLCPEHHALKTYGGWRIEGSPGHWELVAPARPKGAGSITRARRLEAAKAAARRATKPPKPPSDRAGP